MKKLKMKVPKFYLEADAVRVSCLYFTLSFLIGQRSALVVILWHLPQPHCFSAQQLKSLFRAKARVRLVLVDQDLGLRVVEMSPLRLDVRTVRSPSGGPFVRHHTSPRQVSFQLLYGSWHHARLVCVFDAQYELTTIAARKKKIVERCTQSTKVKIPCHKKINYRCCFFIGNPIKIAIFYIVMMIHKYGVILFTCGAWCKSNSHDFIPWKRPSRLNEGCQASSNEHSSHDQTHLVQRDGEPTSK